MKYFDNLSQPVSILANLGVIVGIIFLIIEIRQNDEMLIGDQRLREAEAYASILDQAIEQRRFMASDPVLTELMDRAYTESPTFSPTEWSQLNNVATIWPQIIHAAFRYWDAGHLPDQAWNELRTQVEDAKNSDLLLDRIYIRSMGGMPEDMRDYFGITPRSEQPPIGRSEYVN